MADFHTHVTFSSVLGCGYAAAGAAMGVSLDTAMVAGGLCGISGMLPDLDSDTGIPLRESMAFAAAIVPALLRERLHALHVSHDEMVLIAAGLYFFVRFGVTKMIARRTTHRGMFHSVPAALIFAGAAFLLAGSGYNDLFTRCFKAGGVFLGVMSHLFLDEVYSFQVKGARVRVKRSFGTAIKFWSKDTYSNFSTYTKLAVIIFLILGEPTVMAQLDSEAPSFAAAYQQLQQQWSAWKNGTLKPFVEKEGEELEQQLSQQPIPFARPNEPPAPSSPFFQPGRNFFHPQQQPPPNAQPAVPFYDAARGNPNNRQ